MPEIMCKVVGFFRYQDTGILIDSVQTGLIPGFFWIQLLKLIIMSKVGVNWSGEMAFEVEVNGFKIPIDADEKVGGKK